MEIAVVAVAALACVIGAWLLVRSKRRFSVGDHVVHPTHGRLTVVDVTRRVPHTLLERSRLPFRVAIVAAKEQTVVATDFDTGEMKVVSVRLEDADEDVYVLEKAAGGPRFFVRVRDARGWGVRSA